MKVNKMQKKPYWLRKRFTADPKREAVAGIIKSLGLNTVCREANCPNAFECFASGTATFLILGKNCTRDCAFCNVARGKPDEPDPSEPERVSEAVAALGIRFAVVTSVTRDDLADGGASHFAKTVEAIRRRTPQTAVEVLIPDFQGDDAALSSVAEAAPDVIGHNTETVKELYPAVRPQADYGRSLELIGKISALGPGIKSKSGIMLGFGETRDQVMQTLRDLREAGCAFLTIGQYLAPSPAHAAPREYVHPSIFEEYRAAAESMGFAFTASAPFVRSSYRAHEAMERKNGDGFTPGACERALRSARNDAGVTKP
jgi:lipoic acid synthetase